MMMDRKTFILRTILVGTTPAFANILMLPSAAQSRAAPLPGPSPPQPAANESGVNRVIFKIHGWDYYDNVAKISSESPTSDPPGDPVWISINQSWRTAWR